MVGALVLSIALLLSGLLTSCSSTGRQASSCTQKDWYELGRRDGAQGATLDRLSRYQRECGPAFNPNWETIYVNGRNAGLVEYCSPDSGFELGRMGLAYMYVCPSTVEASFLRGYRKGQQTRQLELENKELDAQINSLSEKLDVTAERFERNQLSEELEQLRRSRAKNDRQLETINR